MSEKLIFASEDSPKRCQGIDRVRDEQCRYVAAHNQIYCVKHLTSVAFRQKRRINNQYKLAIYSKEIEEQTERSDVKHLGEEIGLCRMVTQTILSLCNVDEDLLQYTPQLSILIRLTQEIATTLHAIEVSMETLLDKGILFDCIEQALETILPYIRNQQKQQNLVDDLLLIVAEEIGAGNKIPVKPVQLPGEEVVPFNLHYRIAHWDLQLKTYYKNPRLTDLRGELALSRVLLQSTLNSCTTPATLLHNLSKVVGNLNLIRGLTATIQKIDFDTGYLLDRSNVLNVADKLATTIANYLDNDQEVLTTASQALYDVFKHIIPPEANLESSPKLGQNVLEVGGNVSSNSRD